MARRRFMKHSVLAGTGLVLAVSTQGCQNQSSTGTLADNGGFSPNIWLTILADGGIRLSISKAEMGQGITTALAMLVAEELDARWDDIRLDLVDASDSYGNMATAGSTSIRELWQPIRQASAAAREMLLQAAATKLGVAISECHTDASQVVHSPSGRKLAFSAVANSAAGLPVPQSPKLKQPGEFRIIGTDQPRIDAEDKITGAAVYGIDVTIPDMKYAAIRQSPVFGGKPAGVDRNALMSKPGILAVVMLEDAVAVVAESWWQADTALRQAEIHWQGGDTTVSDSRIQSDYRALADQEGSIEFEKGQPTQSDNLTQHQAVYEADFQAHAALEPMNCTALVQDGRCEVWVPTQNPQYALDLTKNAVLTGVNGLLDKIRTKLGMADNDTIQIHPTLLGGGFGRRLKQDYVYQAVEISKQSGYPVKLIWNRDEDIQHDYFRPYTYHKITAQLQDSRIADWHHRIIGPTHGRCVGGSDHVPYKKDYFKVDYHVLKHGIPIGSWRSVGSSHNTFVIESFVDELAGLAQRDPYQYRLEQLLDEPRLRQVMEQVAASSNWQPLDSQGHRAMGIAVHKGYGTYVAMVAQVSRRQGGIGVDKVYAAVDCGIAINPDIVRSQLEGAIVFALTATLKSRISIEGGQVQQSNFRDFPLLSLAETPEIHVQVLKSPEAPGGIGEVGVPPLAPAVCNAVYQLTGSRIRRIPFNPNEV